MNKILFLLICTLFLSACNSGTESSSDTAPIPSTSAACQGAMLPAFPGAEGFGSCATGGRGGQVLYVTTLEADPRGEIPGSLQWALNQPGKRYILFKVSGTINGTVEMTQGDVTLAGQTSPQGVIVRGLNIQGNQVCEADNCPLPTIYPQNFIIRHLRSRVVGGPSTPAFLDQDALRLHHAVNGIIDHFSAENAEDEAIQISFSRDISIQNSILAETIGDHARYGGMLINYSDPPRSFPLDRLSIHHNLWNRTVGRLPEISRDNPASNGSILEIEVSNNLIWDPGVYMEVALHQPENASALLFYHMNVVGNVFFARALNTDALGNFTYGLMDSSFLQDLPATHPTTTFFLDNAINLYPDRRDYQLLYRNNDYPTTLTDLAALPYPDPSHPPSFARTTRHNFPAITYTAPAGLRSYMLAQAGAFPRDAMDLRLMDFVNRQTFDNNPRNLNLRRDAFLIPNSTTGSPMDSDNDGMPDDWERARGLNPMVQDHNGTQLSTQGYTNLEVYLNELANSRTGI